MYLKIILRPAFYLLISIILHFIGAINPVIFYIAFPADVDVIIDLAFDWLTFICKARKRIIYRFIHKRKRNDTS